MNAPMHPAAARARALAEAVEAATGRIAPAWPLDRLIAVNPFQGHADEPIAEAQARLRWLCGTRLSMPRTWYRDEWLAGRLTCADLQAAIDGWIAGGCVHPRAPAGPGRRTAGSMLDALRMALDDTGGVPAAHGARLPLATAVAEPPHLPGQPLRWADIALHQVSQHNAAFFDRSQSAWRPHAGTGLYAGWRERTAFDRGLPGRPGRPPLRTQATALPADPMAVIAEAADASGIAGDELEAWCEALLLDVGGWAAWCAWLRHQHRLDQGAGAACTGAPGLGPDDDALHDPRHDPMHAATTDPLVELLAIRAGWEWLLLRDDPRLAVRLRAAWRTAADLRGPHADEADCIDWLLQSAVEHAYCRTLCEALREPVADADALHDDGAVEVQAMFCIDVRSEPYRRALEATGPGIRTLGFAGFFGLPVAFVPLGTPAALAQVPGLLAPTCHVTETVAPACPDPAVAGADVVHDRSHAAPCDHDGADARLGALRQRRLDAQRRWTSVRTAAASTFGFVESLGLAYAGKLLKDSLPWAGRAPRPEDNGLRAGEAARLRLRLGARPGQAAGPQAAVQREADLAASVLGVLAASGLKPPFAPLVLVAGHGSRTRNNPHAAGLECGACGGHGGEVNARLLASLLNDRRVRDALRMRGLPIEDATWFVAGLHDTTTDELVLFEDAPVPPTHAAALARLGARLRQASEAARARRAPTVSPALAGVAPARLLRALRQRANDWAQTRPEWGLAGNAAFIAAPRARTAHLDLQGRVFLHDYHWADDPALSVLELVMSAPMVVAHWINMQYYASTVDNVRYGSGNKLLHNVVGGTLGVFEGNGGDLRIGLPWQSLHDGDRLRHAPLRLHVFIDAPAAAIEKVLDRQPGVRALVDNGWLHLFRLGAPGSAPERRVAGGWMPA
ncbi:MAG: YbcC family protein [bacterium]|nr:DUF2309 domain-containing protein [Betaproteobacteria bacterium]